MILSKVQDVACDCKVGLMGRCSCVAAVLLMLSNCSWNKEKSETNLQANFMSQCMNPVTENIQVICSIGIPEQMNIEDSLV